MTNELDFITTQDMLVELEKRHEAMVFVAMQDLDSERVAYLCHIAGGDVKALGLAEFAGLKIRHNLIERSDERAEEAEDLE